MFLNLLWCISNCLRNTEPCLEHANFWLDLYNALWYVCIHAYSSTEQVWFSIGNYKFESQCCFLTFPSTQILYWYSYVRLEFDFGVSIFFLLLVQFSSITVVLEIQLSNLMTQLLHKVWIGNYMEKPPTRYLLTSQNDTPVMN